MDRRIPRRFARIACTVVAALLVAGPAAGAEDSWAGLLKGGHVVLIRHGNAPPGYGGDPPGFKPGTLVLVTHALTVRALLGFLPLQGETVVLRPGDGGAGAAIVGMIPPPK